MFLSDSETASLTPTSYETAAVISALWVKLVGVTALFNVFLWSHSVYRMLLWGSTQIIPLTYAFWHCTVICFWRAGQGELGIMAILFVVGTFNNVLYPFSQIPVLLSDLVLQVWQWRIEASGLYHFPRFSSCPNFLSPFMPCALCLLLSLPFSHSPHLLPPACQGTPASHQPNEQWYSANSMW